LSAISINDTLEGGKDGESRKRVEEGRSERESWRRDGKE
jgi:hypothetical protein